MKISVKDGSKRKKWHHDLSHTCSTTTDFGFCQPIMSRELNSDDTVNMSIGQFVRLGVVVKPTFGRIQLKTYNRFVPIETVFEPWGSLQAGQQYSHGGNSYIPSQVWSMRISDLWKLCCLRSEICIFQPQDWLHNSGIGVQIINLNASVPYIPSNGREFFELFFGSQYLTEGVTSVLDDLVWSDISTTLIEQPSDAQKNLSYYDWWYPVLNGQGVKLIIAGRFTRAGKNLRSILIGCGHQMNLQSVRERSLLNLFAYYKSYFDLFNPNRFKTWKDTSLYGFMETAQTNNKYSSQEIFNNSSIQNIYRKLLVWFLIDLPQCYYTYNPDYVSGHISGTALNVATQVQDGNPVETDGPAFPFLDGTNNLDYVGANSDSNQNASLLNQGTMGGFAAVNRSALRILDILSKRINIHTAIGTRIGAYLRSVFGSQYFERDIVDDLGSQRLDIDISEVMSFAETSEGSLGEYAGKGIGSISVDAAEHVKFTAPETGFLVSFICLVPESTYSQGYDPLLSHIHRREFFDPDFDGVTLLPTEQSSIYGISEVGGFNSLAESFGNMPVFSEYKVAQGVLNGDMSRASTRTTFLPFTLDKLMPYTYIFKETGNDNWKLGVFDNEVIVNGTIWRYCNLHRWLGNYNRIFLESGHSLDRQMFFDIYNFFTDIGIAEDNFIIHNYIQLKVEGYALPLKDSFDTGANEGATFEVQKA